MNDGGLSWQEAKAAASEWLGSLRLGRDITGRSIDLSKKPFPFTGKFRRMVLDSVRRKLKKRGVREVILPPSEPPAEQPPSVK